MLGFCFCERNLPEGGSCCSGCHVKGNFKEEGDPFAFLAHKEGTSSPRATEPGACGCLRHKLCLFTVFVTILGLPVTCPCAAGSLGGVEEGRWGDGDEVGNWKGHQLSLNPALVTF